MAWSTSLGEFEWPFIDLLDRWTPEYARRGLGEYARGGLGFVAKGPGAEYFPEFVQQIDRIRFNCDIWGVPTSLGQMPGAFYLRLAVGM